EGQQECAPKAGEKDCQDVARNSTDLHGDLASAYAWKGTELVIGRRGSEGPFQRLGTLSPRIGLRYAFARKRLRNENEKQHQSGGRDVGADGGNEVPAGEGVGVVGIAARHAGETEKMLREEHQVHAYEHGPEMQLAERLVVHVAAHLREPVVEAGEDGEGGAQ